MGVCKIIIELPNKPCESPLEHLSSPDRLFPSRSDVPFLVSFYLDILEGSKSRVINFNYGYSRAIIALIFLNYVAMEFNHFFYISVVKNRIPESVDKTTPTFLSLTH